jgi:HSP20 family molecular chaperone IbpA
LTWKGPWTAPPREPDPLDDELDELVRAAQEDMEGAPSRTEEKRDSGEIIESPDEVTFLLLAPGYNHRDISVRAEKDKILVQTPGLSLEKELHCFVDSSTLSFRYVNGVLSARVAKRY